MGFEVCIGVLWGEETPDETSLPQEKQERGHSCLLVLRTTAPEKGSPLGPARSPVFTPRHSSSPSCPPGPGLGL